MSLIIDKETEPGFEALQGRRTIVYKDGRQIYYQGDPADSLLAISSGAVRLSTMSPDGQEVTLGVMRPPEAISDGLLSGKRSTDAYASGLTTVIPIGFRSLTDIPGFNFIDDLLTPLARQLRKRTLLYRDLITKPVIARFAGFLLREANEQQVYETLNTQHTLGTIIGCTRESINAALRELRKKELVIYSKSRRISRYEITDPTGLEELSETYHHP